MKDFLLVLTLLICLYSKGQVSYQENVKELVILTVSEDRLNGMKNILLSDLLETEKEGFTKQYDSISNAFYNSFEKYYTDRYNSEEIQRLLDFYKTPYGYKLAGDIGKFYQGNLPDTEQLNKRVVKIRKDLMNVKSNNIGSDNIASNTESDIAKLLPAIGVKQYLDAVKENQIMNVEPRFEGKFIQAFDRMAIQYVIDLKQYLNQNYTENEIHELLLFYETPLGKKVKKNVNAFIKATFDINNKWVDDTQQIMHDTTFGKFQRPQFKKE